ncbi:hypothetical protein C7212DRAFT_312619, partial [Tuber magnatum]
MHGIRISPGRTGENPNSCRGGRQPNSRSDMAIGSVAIDGVTPSYYMVLGYVNWSGSVLLLYMTVISMFCIVV